MGEVYRKPGAVVFTSRMDSLRRCKGPQVLRKHRPLSQHIAEIKCWIAADQCLRKGRGCIRKYQWKYRVAIARPPS
jgi:hypothetical protein